MKITSSIFKRLGFKNTRVCSDQLHLHADFTGKEKEIILKVKQFTMTSPERLVSLIRAIDYLEKSNVNGSIVECGVWKGGSIMAALLALREAKNYKREIYLYDTFEGMSAPTDEDVDYQGDKAKNLLNTAKDTSSPSVWCYNNVDEVKKNVYSTGFPTENIHIIKGEVEKTLINEKIPDKIALLRLDTDWYESTKVELSILFPNLVKGGIIIIDDYGHWKGARKAVDEYIEENNINLFLSRIDYTGRIAVKI